MQFYKQSCLKLRSNMLISWYCASRCIQSNTTCCVMTYARAPKCMFVDTSIHVANRYGRCSSGSSYECNCIKIAASYVNLIKFMLF